MEHSQVILDNDVLVCAPEYYKDLKDISDDYDLSAKLLYLGETNPALKRKIEQAINGEDLQVYGPSTNYKSKYSYNRDN